MKLVYAMTRQQFGKVLTPLKVAYARLPLAFGLVARANLNDMPSTTSRDFSISKIPPATIWNCVPEILQAK